MTSPKVAGVLELADAVPPDSPGALEIGFAMPQQYNASRILFDNLSQGRGDRLALTGPAGTRSYAELGAEASRWGHGLQSLGLKRGDRVLMFLDDTPAYPAAFFGAVRAGLVPLLTNTLTPPDLLQFYLSDSRATLAICDAALRAHIDAHKAHPDPFRRVVVGASRPVRLLTLVYARTPAAPQDTVRAWSTGRGRQSESRGPTLKRVTATLSRIPSGLPARICTL